VPAGGLALRSRAALGPRQTGITTGLRGARLTADRPKRVTPVKPGLRKLGSGAEPTADAFALASAAVERRQASAPRKQISRADCVHLSAARLRARASTSGNACRCCADPMNLRLSALRSLGFFEDAKKIQAKLGRESVAGTKSFAGTKSLQFCSIEGVMRGAKRARDSTSLFCARAPAPASKAYRTRCAPIVAGRCDLYERFMEPKHPNVQDGFR
jgi:hypothetical protein